MTIDESKLLWLEGLARDFPNTPASLQFSAAEALVDMVAEIKELRSQLTTSRELASELMRERARLKELRKVRKK